MQTLPDGSFSYLGQKFPSNNNGKTKIGRLFRASVIHLTTHTLAPFKKEKIAPKQEDSIVEAYAKTIVNDVYINAYIQAWYPDRFFDIAYANTLAFQKIKSSERIFTTSTKLMSALLTKLNMGLIKNSPGVEEEKTLDQVFNSLMTLKETFLGSIAGEKINLDELFDEKVKEIKCLLEPFGPFLEAPSLRHTESTGAAAFTAKRNQSKMILKACLYSHSWL